MTIESGASSQDVVLVTVGSAQRSSITQLCACDALTFFDAESVHVPGHACDARKIDLLSFGLGRFGRFAAYPLIFVQRVPFTPPATDSLSVLCSLLPVSGDHSAMIA